ncbi:MAG: tetratricopeptide repeat protein, partial [Pseudomonadota bacterium]
MHQDRHGNPLTNATPAAVEAINRAMEAFGRYRGDPVGALDLALREAPDCASAHLFKGYLFALATEPRATNNAH